MATASRQVTPESISPSAVEPGRQGVQGGRNL